MNFNKLIATTLSFLLACFATIHLASAQRVKGDVGIGIQGGQPSGLSLQVYNPTGMSLDVLGAWDLNDFYFANVHGVFTQHLGNSDVAHVFYGPGVFMGVRDNKNDDDILQAGLSGTLGLSFMISKVELYGRVTPRLQLIDKTDADIGGGLGLRVYF